MKKIIFTVLVLALLPFTFAFSQTPFYTESFESYDSLTLPPGWLKVDYRPYGINDTMANWRVRDSAVSLPGLTNATARAYDGMKSIMATWWALDTVESIADSWLITKRFDNLPSDAIVSFYACGGSTSYSDSMQVRLSPTGDTAISSFTVLLMSIHWPVGTTYGNYLNYFEDLSTYAGQNVRIAFRYYMDCNINGFAVFLDKFQMLGTVGINQIGKNVPTKFALAQNYPNPFNPYTKIKFDIPRNTNARLEVFNSLGQLVKVLYEGYTTAGYYETDFNAGNLTSGVYYYRLTADNFVETKRMILVK